MKRTRRIPRVVAVQVVRPHVIRIVFDDDVIRDVEYLRGLARPGGVFEALEDPAYFALAFVDSEAGTVSWPNGVDLAPEVLHGDHDFPPNAHFRHMRVPPRSGVPIGDDQVRSLRIADQK